MIETSPEIRDIYSVSRLNREIRTMLETGFPAIWLEGELSNLARPASGHLYFSLKDEAAQVRCAMFRNRNQLLKFRADNGLQVLVRARVSLYEARGDYQLIVEHMEEAGDGALRRAFEELKHKLDAEGLFATEHKKTLPRFPGRIGVITSPSGAAIRDIVTTLRRRFPGLPVVLYPVPVQGSAAAPAIVQALHNAARRDECDVLILARGGGSLEDLWPFNEEAVARAVYDCPIPVVSGVGHEVDITIVDFVADVRAPTPTAAAELVSPNQYEWQQSFTQLSQRLTRLIQQQLRQSEQHLGWLAHRLPHPRRYLQSVAQRMDELDIRRNHALRYLLQRHAARLDTLRERLQQHNPRHALHRHETQRKHLTKRLGNAIRRRIQDATQQLGYLTHSLDTVSPLATLSRGYAIVTRESDDTIITDVKQIQSKSRIRARLHRGRFTAVVDGIEDEKK